jgi:hypothetical protein
MFEHIFIIQINGITTFTELTNVNKYNRIKSIGGLQKKKAPPFVRMELLIISKRAGVMPIPLLPSRQLLLVR